MISRSALAAIALLSCRAPAPAPKAAPAPTPSAVPVAGTDPQEDDRYVYFPLFLTVVPIPTGASSVRDVEPLPLEHDQGHASFSQAIAAATEREAFIEAGALFVQAAERFAAAKSAAYREGLDSLAHDSCYNAVLAFVRGKDCERGWALTKEPICGVGATEGMTTDPQNELCPGP